MLNDLNDFELLENNKILGEGAFSQVVRVRCKKNGRIYALKKIDIDKVSHADCQNLKSEIALHKSLVHQNIIRFYDAL